MLTVHARRTRPRHHIERHLSHRAGWLRAAVLGANDGLLSTAGLLVGVAASGAGRPVVAASGVAALVAGAASMAVGELSSVASQRDAEEADLAREREELVETPRAEQRELAGIYERRGLTPHLADQVAEQLTAHDALEAHARDELGLDPDDLARPGQAAVTSAFSFSLGALVPLLVALLVGSGARVAAVVAVTLVGLGTLGATGARLGGAPPLRPTLRVVAGGAAAMAVTALIGSLFDVAVS
ncbi:VIT family protein [Iamia sp.]|jgi:VIT1/CCC1 family predicted Fe2+/Mn2+ transporter|uniref:VIT1/CCC1 transporter family protein n=1 Tax=Iamia sp. TaxID=2722710 RepID=UPI002D1BBB67|nr:VIT family protein [Iamia sp.]HXH58144.1 VIT family protein [Iamia sp.]